MRTSRLAEEFTFSCTFRLNPLLTRWTSTKNALFSHDQDVKQAPSPSRSSSTTARRRGRRAIEYALLLIGCVVFVDALVGEKGLLETVKKRQEFKVLEQSIRRARAENELLRQEAKRLRSDPTAIEDLARRELGLIRPGEHLFILKDRPPSEGR
jgi:cell division protein FtsB